MNTGIFAISRQGRYIMTTTQLNLSENEVLTLKNTLESYISDLRMEIADTEEIEFRDRLKKEEVILTKILKSLSS